MAQIQSFSASSYIFKIFFRKEKTLLAAARRRPRRSSSPAALEALHAEEPVELRVVVTVVVVVVSSAAAVPAAPLPRLAWRVGRSEGVLVLVAVEDHHAVLVLAHTLAGSYLLQGSALSDHLVAEVVVPRPL